MRRQIQLIAPVLLLVSSVAMAPALFAGDSHHSGASSERQQMMDQRGMMRGHGEMRGMMGRMRQMMDHCASMMSGADHDERPNERWRR